MTFAFVTLCHTKGQIRALRREGLTFHPGEHTMSEQLQEMQMRIEALTDQVNFLKRKVENLEQQVEDTKNNVSYQEYQLDSLGVYDGR